MLLVGMYNMLKVPEHYEIPKQNKTNYLRPASVFKSTVVLATTAIQTLLPVTLNLTVLLSTTSGTVASEPKLILHMCCKVDCTDGSFFSISALYSSFTDSTTTVPLYTTTNSCLYVGLLASS